MSTHTSATARPIVSGAVVFLFDTTHHVLWAEEIAMEAGIPADVVPAPPDRDEARCDLALETFRVRADDLAERLAAEGIVYYRPSGADEGSPPG